MKRNERFRATRPSSLGPLYDGSRTVPLLLSRYEIDKQLVRARHARRQLPEPGVARVDVDTLAVPREELAARLRLFSRIGRGHHRLVLRVPLFREVEAALLHPGLEILGHDL